MKPYLWAEVGRAEANAAKFGQDCGLDATGHARISRDLGLARNLVTEQRAQSMREMSATGAAIRRRRLAELGANVPSRPQTKGGGEA